MVDSNWIKKGDECSAHPKNCPDGYSFSIWEKSDYDPDIMINYGLVKFPRKYIVSSGAEFDTESGTSCPGFAIYRQGADLKAIVSTGVRVWNVTVTGQLKESKWINIGIRWKASSSKSTPIGGNSGNDAKIETNDQGIELYINKELVGKAVFPTRNKKGKFDFVEKKDCKVDGRDPPVITLGCTYNRTSRQFDQFGNGEYDELAIWNRQLVKNDTLNEMQYFLGGYSAKFQDVDPQEFQKMMDNVNLASNQQAKLAQDVLQAMILGPPTTVAPIPTRTADPDADSGTDSQETTPMQTVQTTTETTTEKSNENRIKVIADEQLSLQSALTSLLVQTRVVGSCTAEEVQGRLSMAVVAGKLLSGEKDNVEKWEAVSKVYPHEEGAPKTLRELNWYMLDYVGCVNISSDREMKPFFDPNRNSMNFFAKGNDFVMNGDKYFADDIRKNVRLTYPNYEGAEWGEARKTWDSPNDTYSVPTGMFKDQPGCNDKPITVIATILNDYGKSAPKRRNPALVVSRDWQIDSKVVSVMVDVNPDTMEYNYEVVAKCTPDLEYMKYNPVRATLYHKNPQKARLKERVARRLLWHTNMQREGVELRQCAWWNHRFGSNGAWDPSVCVVKETDDEKTTCECSRFGSVAVISEQLEKYELKSKDCGVIKLCKYLGIGISIICMLIFIIACITSKHIWDMFHCTRMHFFICWIAAVSFHVITDMKSVRDDEHMNLIFGLCTAYFYVASSTWLTCEAHATFKAFTSGIISGRNAVYIPFGYGTPFMPIGMLFLFFHDHLGTGPRAFISFDTITKNWYFFYLVGVSFIGFVLGLIILFNVAKPQTKRKSSIPNLNSQAKGTIGATILMFVFNLMAFYVYARHPESEYPDFYCQFTLLLGFAGIGFFILLGIGSRRFRTGFRGKLAEKRLQMEAAMGRTKNEDFTDIEGNENVSPTLTRPTTAASNISNQDDDKPSETDEDDDEDDDSNKDE